MSAPPREQVLAIVEARVANENLRRHMLATEAIMRGVAERLGEDPDLWGLAGLAHDLDCEETEDDFTRHGVVAAEAAARARCCPRSVVHAVVRPQPGHGGGRRVARSTSRCSPPTSSAA